MIIQKISVWTEINFALGKNGGYMPCCLGDRSISVGKQGEGGSEEATEGMRKKFWFHIFKSVYSKA